MGTSAEPLEKVCSHFVVSDGPNFFSRHTKKERQKGHEAARQQMSKLLAQNAKE